MMHWTRWRRNRGEEAKENMFRSVNIVWFYLLARLPASRICPRAPVHWASFNLAFPPRVATSPTSPTLFTQFSSSNQFPLVIFLIFYYVYARVHAFPAQMFQAAKIYLLIFTRTLSCFMHSFFTGCHNSCHDEFMQKKKTNIKVFETRVHQKHHTLCVSS